MTQGLYLFDQNFYSSLRWLCTTGTRLFVVGVTSEAGEGEAPKYLVCVCVRAREHGLLSCGYDLVVIVSRPSFYSSRRVYITIAFPVRKTKMGPLLHVSDVSPLVVRWSNNLVLGDVSWSRCPHAMRAGIYSVM